MTKHLSAAALAAALLLPAVAAAQAPGAILIVDTDRILTECTACRAASAQLTTQVQQAQQRQQTLQAQLQSQGQALQASVNALQGKQPDAALQARITAFQQQRDNAAQELQGTEERIRSTQQNVQRQIYARLGPIIAGVQRQRNASIVLAKNATLASADPIEVTNDVLTQLNAQLPSVSVTPLPAQNGAASATVPATSGRRNSGGR